MKILALSDIHQTQKKIYTTYPNALYSDTYDIIVIAGDITNKGSLFEYELFLQWLSKLKAKYKIIIAGNHDYQFYLQHDKSLSKDLTTKYGCIYLEDEYINIEGLNIYGFPWTPTFCNWAFMLDRDSVQMQYYIDNIPENLDILISHGPCYGILDMNLSGEHCGCTQLLERIKLVKPKYHIFGHIHSNEGDPTIYKTEYTTHLNVSICNDSYVPINSPTIIKLG